MSIKSHNINSRGEHDANNPANPTDDDKTIHTPVPAPKQLPKGVVLDKDGKPCRSCTSFAAWAAMSKKQTSTPLPSSTSSSNSSTSTSTSSTTSATSQPIQTLQVPQQRADCPPDVEALGNASWTLLHSITATYPENPPPATQATARQFIASFASLYPCWHCGSDFKAWMAERGNAPRVSSRSEFGMWMCQAHNAVNEKLGKERFDCQRWEERWRSGWKDGRCD